MDEPKGSCAFSLLESLCSTCRQNALTPLWHQTPNPLHLPCLEASLDPGHCYHVKEQVTLPRLVSSLWVIAVQREIHLVSHSGHIFKAATLDFPVGNISGLWGMQSSNASESGWCKYPTLWTKKARKGLPVWKNSEQITLMRSWEQLIYVKQGNLLVSQDCIFLFRC